MEYGSVLEGQRFDEISREIQDRPPSHHLYQMIKEFNSYDYFRTLGQKRQKKEILIEALFRLLRYKLYDIIMGRNFEVISGPKSVRITTDRMTILTITILKEDRTFRETDLKEIFDYLASFGSYGADLIKFLKQSLP